MVVLGFRLGVLGFRFWVRGFELGIDIIIIVNVFRIEFFNAEAYSY
jgi:hypothetical protein